MNSSAQTRSSEPVSPPKRIHEWWVRHRALYELATCDQEEKQRLLRDLNLTERDLAAAIRSRPNAQGLLFRMLRQLGLEYEGIEALYPSVAWDLVRVCAACPNRKRCRRELESSTARTHFREFCFNATTLDALTADPVRRTTELERSGTETESSGQ